MAKSEQKANLNQKKQTKKHKNVLFNPFPYKWPTVDKYFESRLLDELESLLTSLPIQLPKRLEIWRKGKKLRKPNEVEPFLFEKRKKKTEEAKRLRSQIVCGVRDVTKGLEKDDLDLFIVCRSTEPSMITKHLIPLAASRGCPGLGLQEFNPKVAPLLGVTSLVALGFKKIPMGTTTEFSKFVTYAKSVAPPFDSPLANKSLDMKSVSEETLDEASVLDDSGDGSSAQPKKKPDETVANSDKSKDKDDAVTNSDKPQGKVINDAEISSGFISLSESTLEQESVEDKAGGGSSGQSEHKSDDSVAITDAPSGFISLSGESQKISEDIKPSSGFISLSIKSESREEKASNFDKAGGSGKLQQISEDGKDSTGFISLFMKSESSPDDMEKQSDDGSSSMVSDLTSKDGSLKEGCSKIDTDVTTSSGAVSLSNDPSDKNTESTEQASLFSKTASSLSSPVQLTESTTKSSLVFPLDGPPPFVAKSDYSHLYVFKDKGQFGDDFISLADPKGTKRELSDEEIGTRISKVSRFTKSTSSKKPGGALGMEGPLSKKSKMDESVVKFQEYKPAIIRGQVPNLKRKKKT